MAVTEIIHFGAESSLDVRAPRKTGDDTIQKVIEAIGEAKGPPHFALGTQIQDERAVQITLEWEGVQNYINFDTTSEFDSFIRTVRNFYGEPQRILHVALSRSAFGPDGPATANVVEFAQSYFPASGATPEFQKQVEVDFLTFNEIYSTGAKGDLGWAFGWVLEEQEHENIKDEKAKCFLVMRGWESMGHFEQSVKTEAYKEAIPLLFAWNAPFKMVGVCSVE